MLSTGVSAVLGLGFWLVAARYYSEDAVGQSSAAIAAMRLLASVTATTMIGAVVRFVPRAGRATASLVWRTYAVSSAIVALVSVGFLLTLDLWGPSYAPLGTPAAGALFVAACVAWAVLTLQDGVLTGLRKAFWVPVGNTVFSLGKLVLLAVVAGAMPVLGIFVSWAVAIAFSTLPLGWLVFRRLIPNQAAADRDREPPRLRAIGRFLAGDSVGALFSLAMINLLPVMVAVRFSAAENGYFYVAYTVGGTMEFMAINMASSLTAHASHDPQRLAEGVRGALRRMTVLLVPVVLVLIAFAPLILAPFGKDYAEHGALVLRLLAAAALPRVAVELYIGVLRVQGRTGVLAALQGTMCTLVLGSAALLLTRAGIAGAGWAMLLGMTAVAAVCVPGLRSALRGTARMPADMAPASAPSYGTRWARLNAAGYGTNWARRAAYEHEGRDTDTAALFLGRSLPDREPSPDDTLALTTDRVPHPPDAAGPGGGGPSAGPAPPRGEAPGASGGHGTAPARPGDGPAPPAAGRGDGTGESRLVPALWAVLGAAAGLFWVALARLPWLGGERREQLTGRELIDGLPVLASAAGVLVLLVFVASVTLCAPGDPWLPGAALAVFTLALHAAPVALGLEPVAVDAAWYPASAWAGPLPRWGPPVCLVLCLVPLGHLLARAPRLPWQARWSVLWLAAVGGWTAQEPLSPFAPPLLVLSALAAGAAPVVGRQRHRRRPPKD
nr:lipopolysaccharide biosynthesis protein [Streptomyces sp. GC420]